MALRKFRKLEEGSSKFSNIRKIRKNQMNELMIGFERNCQINYVIPFEIKLNVDFLSKSPIFCLL